MLALGSLNQACSSSDNDSAPSASATDAGSTDTLVDSSSDAVSDSETANTTLDSTSDAAADSVSDAATGSWCDELRVYQAQCNNGTIECDANFPTWCAAQSKTNSKIFEDADLICLPKVGCKSSDRNDCRYRLYDASKLTAVQNQLLEAYCQTCSASDVAGCKTKALAYDPSKGPDSVDDIFVAVWEFSDSLTDVIRTTCTGAALVIDGGTCADAFANCAADPYLNAMPDCPK
jgi:hypothetical protein